MAKNKGKKKKKSGFGKRFKEKLEMYDMILANMIAGDAVTEPTTDLDRAHIEIGYSNIASETTISKYFVIREYPDYIKSDFLNELRTHCAWPDVKFNYYIYGQPHVIHWESNEMKNKVAIWSQYADETSENVSAFEYRGKRAAVQTRERLINSTMYLNVAELDQNRTLNKISIVLQLTCNRDIDALVNMHHAIRELKRYSKIMGLGLRELKINMIDWMSTLSIFSMRGVKETYDKLTRKIVTDDIIANFGAYTQGRIGEEGIPVGIDVNRKEAVLYKFKSDPNKVENWLISATTGGGKSFFVKSLLLWLLAINYKVTIMDYEGDEYTNLAYFMAESDPDSVKIVSMGKGSAVYVDPMEIPDLTGDPDIDDDLKDIAMGYILGTFRLIVCGNEGQLTKWQESVLSTAIKRVYEERGVTDDQSTWHRSKGLRLHQVYEEIQIMVDAKEFVDDTMDNVKHKAAMDIVESCIPYFEEGEAKSGTFKQPMSLNDLHKAQLIIFSFGVKGATSSSQDATILALKQLSVANISTQISNYSKYVMKTFNVKVWEEFQRYIEAPGTAEIVGNSMTGGRKRGDINFIITNDLGQILDDSKPITKQLRQNISTFCIGKIKSAEIIEEFCEKFPSVKDVSPTLYKIHKAPALSRDKKSNEKGKQSGKYTNAFCVMFDDDNKAAVKSMLPPSIAKSKLFSTGVDVSKKEKEEETA